MCDKNLVVKSNALIEAGHRLSLTEQRIVLTAITKIRRDEAPSSERWYTVTAAELADAAGISKARAYNDLTESVDSLWMREITVKGGPNGAEETTKKGRVMKARWVQAVEKIPDQGAVKLMFSAPLVPYLTVLKKQFTKYELQHVAPMTTRFGPRLYEFLMQWRGAEIKEAEIDALQASWQTSYERIYDFKKRVINPAITDVNKHSDIEVAASYKKTGRKVTHVIFKFKQKPGFDASAQSQPAPPPEADVKEGSLAARIAAMAAEKPKKVLRSMDEANKLARTGESYEQLWPRLKREGYTLKFKPVY